MADKMADQKNKMADKIRANRSEGAGLRKMVAKMVDGKKEDGRLKKQDGRPKWRIKFEK